MSRNIQPPLTERPILFSSPMVRAILQGRKTQTRRVISPPKSWEQFLVVEATDGYNCTIDGMPNGCLIQRGDGDDSFYEPEQYHPCPYGVEGQRLWVRETWLEDPPRDGTWADTQYFGCHEDSNPSRDIPSRFQNPENCLYRASWDGSDLRWRPSIFMPRWASRITLEITKVRVQHVQDISEDDAKAEGIEAWSPDPDWPYPQPNAQGPRWFHFGYRDLWNQINGKKAPWDSNPWVWVVSFRRLEV